MIRIMVDDQPVDLADVTFHFQSDPFPGGLTYRIVAESADLMTLLGEVTRGTTGPLNPDETQPVFTALLGLQCLLCQQSMPPKYCLNTIAKLTVEGIQVELSGVASRHVGGPIKTVPLGT